MKTFILLLLVSVKLFAEQTGVGLVVRHPGTLEPTPYRFEISKGVLWHSNANFDYVGGECPTFISHGTCHLNLSWLGATVVDWQPYIFLQDNHGKVWVAQRSSLDSITWTWKEVGCPFTDSNGKEKCGEMLKGLGATSVRDGLNEPQRPYLFAVAPFSSNTSKVWNLWRDKNEAWHWSDLGCPKDCNMRLGGLGAISVLDYSSPSERPYLFVTVDNTSKVWNLWWNTDKLKWYWSDLGCPDGKCALSAKGLGNMMTSSMLRYKTEGPKRPFVFVAEANNPDKAYYLRWTREEKWAWNHLILEKTANIIGVVSMDYYGEIVPVIVSERKDKYLQFSYLDSNNDTKWLGKKEACPSCDFRSVIPISGTHSPNGSGAIVVYRSFVEKWPEFKTYSF
ncbi:MAG: hypothetical protein KUF74_18665 [Candidatus Thiodiazotropha sp. (ex Ctena orbiculata)]|nr:hypothetical protein [Candidatus Thiodiazotropha taylori]